MECFRADEQFTVQGDGKMEKKDDSFWQHMRILTKIELCKVVPYSPQHIARLEKKGKFPTRIRLGGNRVGWVWFEIEAWILARMDERPVIVPQSEKEMELA